ncbi:DUF2461 domain-containing protein [Mucilaginibacter sp.]|uniref:DUF2461 domain-containing protein n=1 Tax=Mucilaginibacter sp. TaxID=1882438 RepID=UPI0025F5A1BC|nr:DUF2461 domain-containing protein [Mucilaginibacter sp.]
MAKVKFPASAFKFINELKASNDRNWFAANKPTYLEEQARVAAFADRMLRELNLHDVIETAGGAKSMYRIYRDVRFSKDKTPFSTYWGGRFKRAGKQRRGGYYYHFEPGDKSFVMAGFWGPNTQDIKLVRDDIAFDPAPLRAILSNETFVNTFGALQGEQLKTQPKGYDGSHEAVDLLRFKQYLVMRRFTDEEVLSDNFIDLINEAFKNTRPFLDYMSEVLMTDINGILI